MPRYLRDGALGASPSPLLWWTLRAHWALGFLLLFALTDVSRTALLLTGAAFVAGTALDRRGAPRLLLARATAPLLLLAAAASVADLVFGSRDLLFSLSVLILGVQSITFLLPKKARDGWQLCAISFLEFLASAASTTGIQFAAFSFLFLCLCVGAMLSLHLLGRAEGAREAAGVPVDDGFAARVILLSGVAGFLGAAILFIVTPRVGVGQILTRFGHSSGLTGFSNTITLREVTVVKADPSVVARVEFPGRAEGFMPQSLYLRGITYARFDGRSWTRSAEPAFPVPRSGFYYLLGVAPKGLPSLVADITLEPMDHPALFVYGEPWSLEGPLGYLRTDGAGSFSFGGSGHPAIRYKLTFSPERPGRVPSAPPPPGEYLALPPDYDDIRALAARVTAGVSSDDERARRTLAFFRTGFRYTLTNPAASVRDFLFTKNAGYCEHYATALALLLRAAGVPSRVAAGYLGGEWNTVGNYLIVRQSDAHAWTEGWIGGRWMTLDATPPLADDSPYFSRLGFAGACLDWAKQRWNKYVVNYSVKMQGDALAGGWSFLRRTSRAFRIRHADRLWESRTAGGIAGAAFLAAALLFHRLRRRADGDPAGRRPGGGKPSLPRPYARLLRTLAKRGFRRSRGTAMEAMIREAVFRRPDLRAPATRFLDLYHRDRFGGTPLSPGEASEAARLGDRLRREIARSGAR